MRVDKNDQGGERMSKRITIMLDNKLDYQLRMYQAKLIKKSKSSQSFSKTINAVLKGKVPTKA